MDFYDIFYFLYIYLNQLDGSCFFITNKKHDRARVAQWGESGKNVGTSKESWTEKQLWLLEEDKDRPGWYCIKNVHYKDYVIQAEKSKFGQVIKVTIGKVTHTDNQLWQMGQERTYFHIINYKYENAKIVKLGDQNEDLRVSTDLSCDGADLWKLTSKYKLVPPQWEIVWELDNRGSPRDVLHEITSGLTVSNTHTETINIGLEVSLQFAIGKCIGVELGASTKLSTAISSSLTRTETSSWSTTTTYTAPAKMNYRVKQMVARFTSKLSCDDIKVTYKTVPEAKNGDFEELCNEELCNESKIILIFKFVHLCI